MQAKNWQAAAAARGALIGAALLGLSSCATLDGPGALDPRASGGSLFGDLLVARVAGGDRNAEVAAARYGHALKADPQNVQLLERAFLFSLSAGTVDDAVAYAGELVARKESAPLARITLGLNAVKQRRYAEALAQFTKGGESSGNGFTTTMLRAWALAGDGRVEEALRLLAAIPGREANEMFVVLHEGLIADLGGRPEVARQKYDAAMGLVEEPNAGIILPYAALLAASGEPQAALKLLGEPRDVLIEDPAIAAARERLRRGERLERPIRDARDGTAEALFGLANALAGDRGIDLPVVYLQLALDLRPDYDVAAILMGELFQSYDLWEQAAAAYGRVERRSPYYPGARVEMARIFDRKDKTEEALAALKAVSEEGPQAFQALIAKGDIYRSRDRWEEAIAVYEKALGMLATPQPQHWVVYYASGIAHERAKRWPEAEARFKQALALSPNQPLVLNYLGYSWIDQGVNMDEALRMIERAVAERPTDGFIVDSLGWAHFRLGNYEKAVGILEQAVLLQPGDPTLNDHLGDAYWMVGRTREARFQWSHALAFEPEPEQVPLIEAKLKNGLTAPTVTGKNER